MSFVLQLGQLSFYLREMCTHKASLTSGFFVSQDSRRAELPEG